jgi:hydroxypyruvate reductase/glycerate 2-kinase
MAITSKSKLLEHGLVDLRRLALEIAEDGLTAADGGQAVRESIRLVEDGVEVEDEFFRLEDENRLIILGAGKATLPVALALEETLGERIDLGAIVLRRGVEADSGRLEVLHSDHPIPSPDSVRAAERIVEITNQAESGDLVITCFTGGRSALLCLPPEGVSFEEKRRLNELLVSSGMTISEINTVRKHVSRIKGGRLASRMSPARIINLTISDVAGDQLDVLADLTTQDSSTPEDAIDVLERHDLLERVPASVLEHLEGDGAASPDLGSIRISNFMLVNGQRVCDAMVETARDRGLDPIVLSTTLEGDAAWIGEHVASRALEELGAGNSGTVLIGCGGEATVVLGDGVFGEGGPNQEAALAAGLALVGEPVAAVFLDTDGSDGGTEAAGAVCDGETAGRAARLSLDIPGSLESHRSGEALRVLDDLLVTGPTGTNVNDLYVAVICDRTDI